MKHAVVIASKGRPEVLAATLGSVARQTQPPDEVILSVGSTEDLPPRMGEVIPNVRVLMAEGGVTKKLNGGVDACGAGISTVSLLDDDVELAPAYLECALGLFADRPDVLMFDGLPVHAGPCDRPSAQGLIASAAPGKKAFRPGVPVWGCNMNVRRSVFSVERFDESIVSYGWLREYDFGDRVARIGLTGRYEACIFAHLAAPGGRISDLQYGYAQLMNPVYFLKKGTVVRSWTDLVVGHFLKVIAANCLRGLAGDRSCNRWERIRGNLLAVAAAARGVSDPGTVQRIR